MAIVKKLDMYVKYIYSFMCGYLFHYKDQRFLDCHKEFKVSKMLRKNENGICEVD